MPESTILIIKQLKICENKGVAGAPQNGRVRPQTLLRLLFDL